MSRPANLLLFALSPSEALGRAIADKCGVSVSEHELRRFDDGEFKIRPLVSVRGRDCYVVCSLYGDARESVNDRLIRLLFFVGALRDAGAAQVTIVTPYLCYSRKERRTNPRDPISTRYVAQLIESTTADRIVAVDIHNFAAFENAFRIETVHLGAKQAFVDRCRALGDRGLAIVSPDPGGFHRAEALRDALEQLSGSPVELAMLGKHRKGGVVRTEAFVGNVEGRTAVIVDDMIVTGTTLVRAADACRKRGALAVHAMATHGVFSVAAGPILATQLLDSIVVTDTISPERADLGPARSKLSVIPIAPFIARAIASLHDEEPLSELIEAA